MVLYTIRIYNNVCIYNKNDKSNMVSTYKEL
jgi:hypothetical protein